MLKIKLFRYGKRDHARYRIVVAERRSKRGGRYIDQLGTYNPELHPSILDLDQVKYLSWIKKGAQPTVTVNRLAKPLITK